jgi:hypothetical protein
LQKYFCPIARKAQARALKFFEMPNGVATFTPHKDEFQLIRCCPLVNLPPAHAKQLCGFPHCEKSQEVL